MNLIVSSCVITSGTRSWFDAHLIFPAVLRAFHSLDTLSRLVINVFNDFDLRETVEMYSGSSLLWHSRFSADTLGHGLFSPEISENLTAKFIFICIVLGLYMDRQSAHCNRNKIRLFSTHRNMDVAIST